MKKLLSLIMALSMLLPSFTAAAAANARPEVMLNVNYDDSRTNSVPSEVKTDGDGSVVYTAETESGKSLLVKNRWSDTYIKFSKEASDGVVWIDARIKGADVNAERHMIDIDDGITAKPYGLINVSRTGKISDYRGRQFKRVDVKKWHRYTAAVNLKTKRYDIYVDGVLLAERSVLPDGVTAIKSAGFSAMKNEAVESVMYNDYFRVYKADSIPAETAFELPAYNYNSRKLKNDEVTKPAEGQKLLYSEDFSSGSIGEAPAGYVVQSGSCGVQVEDNGNQYCNISWKAGENGMMSMAIGSLGISENLPLKTVYQCDVKVDKNSDGFYLFIMRDGADPYNFSRSLRISAKGDVGFYNGASYGASCRGEWVTVAVANDFETKTHKVYVNNELIAEDVPFQVTGTISRMYHLRFQTDGMTGDGSIMIDNIKIYTGSEPYDENTAIKDDTGGAVMPEKAEVWEHEISKTPLATDMKKFTKAKEYVSANPSSYMTDYAGPKVKFKDTFVMVQNNSNVWINDSKYTSPYKVLWDNCNFLAPADMLAAIAGSQAKLDGDNVTIGGFTGKVGESKVTVGGTEYESKTTVQRIDGTIYVPVREFVIYELKKYYSESEKGLAVIADRQIDLNASANSNDLTQMLAYMVLDRPNTEALNESFKKTGGGHPRIFGSRDKMESVLKLAETDEVLNSRMNSLLKLADDALNYQFNTGGHTVIASSFEVVEAMYAAYVKTGDEKYVKKAEELALLYAGMPTWKHESYFLDVSFWMLVSAEVYDLFYDQLSTSTRDKIANAIIDKGLKHTQEHYYGSYSDWPKRVTNWNSVCNGGSMAAAAILLGDGYDDALCLDVAEKSFVSVGYQLHEYAPYGALFESTGYFSYGTQYLVRAVEAYKNTFGDDFGIIDYPGFLQLGYYPLYTDSNSGGWALHDDGQNVKLSNMYASWTAYYTNDLMLQKARQKQIDDRHLASDFLDVMFYMPEQMPSELDLPLDKRFGGDVEISTSRNDWGKKQFFVGVHAGANSCAHGQWDMGNFIYEAFGIRFATDIGNDSYALGNDYFAEGGAKSRFFVHRTESHNLYVINPDETAGQIWQAKSKVEGIGFNDNEAAYKVDLTPAYYDRAEEATRGVKLTNGRSVLVVQDEIKTRESDDEIKWFWQTAADITINDDNSVTLTRNNKTVTLYFDSNVDFELSSGLGLPMETSATYPGQLQKGQVVNRLTATFYSEEDKIYFRCTAVPFGHETDRGEIVPIAEWTVPNTEKAAEATPAKMIYVNGEPLDGFEAETTDYTLIGAYAKTGLPTVTAESDGKVTVTAADDRYKTAVVTVENESGAKTIYTITFVDGSALGIPEGTRHNVKAVYASDYDSNVPEGAIDNDLNTRWSGSNTGYGWLELDLGEVKEVDAVTIGVYSGKTRANKFDILVSEDGENYTTCIEGKMTSGKTELMELFEFTPVKARYVRLVGHGADVSEYNSYTEFHAYKLAK